MAFKRRDQVPNEESNSCGIPLLLGQGCATKVALCVAPPSAAEGCPRLWLAPAAAGHFRRSAPTRDERYSLSLSRSLSLSLSLSHSLSLSLTLTISASLSLSLAPSLE